MKDISSGLVEWRSPSNIALVKYWGKRFDQIPMNPSVSFTLSATATTTSIAYRPAAGPSDPDTFLFEGRENEAFASRVRKFTGRCRELFPVLHDVALHIESENSFPHSAGIASSASAMSALAMCICTIYSQLSGDDAADLLKSASNLARLGSGSAARSVYGPVCLWGQTGFLSDSSDEYAVEVKQVDDVFRSFCDSILIIDSAEKSVKSSAGHNLMVNHPYATQRFERARRHVGTMLEALKQGDLETFGALTEAEALDLHAMMLTSTPSYMLLRPITIEAIERV